MNNNITKNNKNWSDAIKKSLRDAETPANDRLWNRIEDTLEVSPNPIITSSKSYFWKISSTITAVAALLALIFLSQDSDVIINDNTITLADKTVTTHINSETPLITEIESAKQITETHPINQPITTTEDIINETKTEQPKDKSIRIYNNEEKDIQDKKDNKEQPEKDNEKIFLTDIDTTQPQEVIVNKPRKENKFSIIYTGGLGLNSLLATADYASSDSRELVIQSALSTQNNLAEISFDDIYNSSKITHHQPFGAGVRVEHELSNRFTLNSGINYTLLLSDVDMSDNESLTTQQIHFLGIPIRANYKFLQFNNFSIYAGAGATIEYCIYAKVGSVTIDERNWHYSADINLGAEYTLTQWLGLYFEPSISHYFNNTNLKSIRNDNPTTVNLRIGISFKL